MKIDKEKVKLVMARQGITATTVAERLNRSISSLSQLWQGERESHPKTVYKLADALRVDPKEIVS